MTTASTTSDGAPVISLERTVQPDSMAIVWKPLQRENSAVVGYELYVNNAIVDSPVCDTALRTVSVSISGLAPWKL